MSAATKPIQGVEVPSLGLGTWPLTGDKCSSMVADALEVGYRHIDTAQMYANEAAVGAGIEASGVDRNELFVTTKVDNEQHAPDSVRSSVGRSVDDLGGFVDLLLVHWPVEWEGMPATLGAMAEFVDQGLVAHLGVSNFSSDQLQQAMDWAPIFSIQVEHHPFEQQADLRALAARHDLLLTAYSPLARGRVFDDNTLQQIAHRHGVSAGQVALRWLVDGDNVVPIPRTSTREHLEANLASLEFELSEEDTRLIEALSTADTG